MGWLQVHYFCVLIILAMSFSYQVFHYIYFYHSDNLRFGLQFSRKFVDGSEPNRPNNFKTTKQKRIWSNRLKMNLHNNEVGRQVSFHNEFKNI